jgi:hypothetical protein
MVLLMCVIHGEQETIRVQRGAYFVFGMGLSGGTLKMFQQ